MLDASPTDSQRDAGTSTNGDHDGAGNAMPDASASAGPQRDATADSNVAADAPVPMDESMGPHAVLESITLPWKGTTLAGTLYLPKRSNGPVPGVVTGPGFGGVKEMLIPAFADAAAAAGIATLAIDFAGFGASGGMPRQNVDPPAQVEQTRTALDYLSNHRAIDPARLGVWGTSLSGGHALALTESDKRIRCTVAIIPFINTSQTAISDDVLALVVADTASRLLGLPGGTIAAVGHPGDVAVMTTDGAWEWSEATTKDAPSWKNEVTLESLVNMGAYSPGDNLATIDVPVRAILATSDSITPASLARSSLAGIPNLNIVEKPDSHFELFRDRLDETISLTTEWLVKHLKP
jgi:dienelactone hydrolase